MQKKAEGNLLVTVFMYVTLWLCLVIPLAFTVGSLVALFLRMLNLVTIARWQHPWILYLLPLAGVLIYLLYQRFGKNAEAGTELVIDEIHEPGGGLPPSMTPLVFISTVVTHLFGGSAGREGTAVQMGGSLASLFNRYFMLGSKDLQLFLMAGVAAGFGAVFGTPAAGAVFAIEVVLTGRFRMDAIFPCVLASVLADFVCTSYGVHHTTYSITKLHTQYYLRFDWLLFLKVLAGAVCFGLVAWFFSVTVRLVKRQAARFIKRPWLAPVTGGIIIVILASMLGPDYLGLGVSNPDNGVNIISSFEKGGAGLLSWLWKIIFTSVTLGTGFKGGEVTPLFFIGASLGNALSGLMNTPADLMAGIGLIAVFAAATRTPLASIVLGVELFGSEHVVYYASACLVAFYCYRGPGIYGVRKFINNE